MRPSFVGLENWAARMSACASYLQVIEHGVVSYCDEITFGMRTSPVVGDFRICRLSEVPTEDVYKDCEGHPCFRLEDWRL